MITRLLGTDGPAALPAALMVSPWIADVPALEAPLQPAQFDVAQVLDQFERRPARRQPAAPLFFFRQREHLRSQPRAEEVQVAEEDLGAGTSGGGGFREGDGHPSGL